MGPLATIFGVSGLILSEKERAFFADAQPWGFILFARNVDHPDQVRRLCDDLRSSVGRNALIFIDQEGGRVRRLRPPHWRDYPSGAIYSEIYRANKRSGRRAIWLGHRLIADDLRALGITANCAPVLDLPQAGADPIISDRAFGASADQIVDLGHAAMSGLMAGGVAPVIKHLPGHGRATVDSHLALPVIDTDQATLARTDMAAFKPLAGVPMAMTAHAVYTAVDTGAPMTLSPKGIQTLIREAIGFDGLLMTDDLDMKALQGNSLTSKAEAALSAGCDVVLHCSGEMPDMMDVAKGVSPLSGKGLMRAQIAEYCAGQANDFDRVSAASEFEALLSTASMGRSS